MSVGQKVGQPLATSGLLTEVDTTQQNPLGTQVDDDQGNTYVYQKGCASLAPGDFVVINGDGSVSRSLNTPLTGPVAVCIGTGSGGSAPTATQYGWFQRRGVTPSYTAIATDSGGTTKPLFLSSTAGRATTTLAAGQAILAAWAYGNPASNVGPALLADPFAPGFTLASA